MSSVISVPLNTASPIDLVKTLMQNVSKDFQTKPAAERFSLNVPSHLLSALNMFPIPCATYLNELNSVSGQAMLDKKLSIKAVGSRTGQIILVPFEALGYWSYISKAIDAKRKWMKALIWLKGYELQSPALSALTQEVFSLLKQVYWTDSIPGISSSISMTELADFLLDEWLLDSHIDTMLLQLKACMQEHSIVHNQHIIGCTTLAQSLSSCWLTNAEDNSKLYDLKANYFLWTYGAKLAETRDKPLWFIAFSAPGHWTAVKINPVQHLISWGDSLGKSMPVELNNSTKIWLSHCLQQHVFKYDTSYCVLNKMTAICVQ
ncbi:hypothetical protein BDQ17DRAFT_1427692 [Cyathus striatus]|nr:hypothetical protein BDQ17DRAFT_1427692 [Cyathus striatus]